MRPQYTIERGRQPTSSWGATGPAPIWRDIDNPKRPERDVIALVERLVDEGFGPKNMVVLCNSPSLVDRLRQSEKLHTTGPFTGAGPASRPSWTTSFPCQGPSLPNDARPSIPRMRPTFPQNAYCTSSGTAGQTIRMYGADLGVWKLEDVVNAHAYAGPLAGPRMKDPCRAAETLD